MRRTPRDAREECNSDVYVLAITIALESNGSIAGEKNTSFVSRGSGTSKKTLRRPARRSSGTWKKNEVRENNEKNQGTHHSKIKSDDQNGDNMNENMEERTHSSRPRRWTSWKKGGDQLESPSAEPTRPELREGEQARYFERRELRERGEPGRNDVITYPRALSEEKARSVFWAERGFWREPNGRLRTPPVRRWWRSHCRRWVRDRERSSLGDSEEEEEKWERKEQNEMNRKFSQGADCFPGEIFRKGLLEISEEDPVDLLL